MKFWDVRFAQLVHMPQASWGGSMPARARGAVLGSGAGNGGLLLSDRPTSRTHPPPLLQVIVTPHTAFLTNEALANIADTTAENLVCACLGRPLANQVVA